jgi:hypothetical protein
MKTLIAMTLALTVFVAPAAYAGPSGGGHSHGAPITSDQAAANARQIVEILVSKEKLDKSWSNIKPAETKQAKYARGPEWVVAFNNPAVSDAAKQTLYVFLTLQGDYVAANFSGK